MPVTRPFRAVRYAPERVGDLAAVVAPPYDQIKGGEQEALYRRHPKNLVRLILGREEPGDSERENKYTRARRAYEAWRAEGTLVRDPEPALYVYEEEFSLRGAVHRRSGYVGVVRVEPMERGSILPHERILPKPFEDRRRLLLETGAHFESIFLLYSDPEGRCEAPKRDLSVEAPLTEVADAAGIAHRLWRLRDPDRIASLARAWESGPFYIADGHHRYRTALTHHEETAERDPARAEKTAFCLATLFRLEDPNLVILPTHRVLRGIASPEEVWPKLAGIGRIEPAGSLPGLLSTMERDGAAGRPAFGVATRDRLARLVLHHDSGLDVSVLHQAILGPLLGIGERQVAGEERVEYVRWPEDAVTRVREGGADMAFLLNPTRIEQVREAADRGETMPQKSTDFYPKLLSGLFMYEPG